MLRNDVVENEEHDFVFLVCNSVSLAAEDMTIAMLFVTMVTAEYCYRRSDGEGLRDPGILASLLPR